MILQLSERYDLVPQSLDPGDLNRLMDDFLTSHVIRYSDVCNISRPYEKICFEIFVLYESTFPDHIDFERIEWRVLERSIHLTDILFRKSTSIKNFTFFFMYIWTCVRSYTGSVFLRYRQENHKIARVPDLIFIESVKDKRRPFLTCVLQFFFFQISELNTQLVWSKKF